MTWRALAETRTGRAIRPAALALLLPLAACGGADDTPQGPAATAALGLFELARIDEPSDELLSETFDPAPGRDGRAALLDALGGLATAIEPQVVAVLQPEGPADAFVDLTAGLPGGGLARFNVRLHSPQPGSWRVSWFQGPGVAWPPRSAPRGAGLSSSHPPETPR
jgi:hypothetical protein